MRFVLGLLLGFGIGLGGAILFAPEKKKQAEWPPHFPETDKAAGNHHDSANSLRAILSTVRERVDEALAEAREAKKQAERDMLERYERAVRRK